MPVLLIQNLTLCRSFAVHFYATLYLLSFAVFVLEPLAMHCQLTLGERIIPVCL